MDLGLLRRCLDDPGKASEWLGLAQSALDEGDHLTGYWAAEHALSLPDGGTSYAHDLCSTCAFYVGLPTRSLEEARMAWRMDRSNPRLAANLKFLRRGAGEHAFHLLWPSVGAFRGGCAAWMERASAADRVRSVVAVRAVEVGLEGPSTVVVGECGVVRAACTLVRSLMEGEALPGDVVLLVPDGAVPPVGWDGWIHEQLVGHDGALVVNDGAGDGEVGLPAMDVACLFRLNGAVLHDSYLGSWACRELMDNLVELGLVRNLRSPGLPVFGGTVGFGAVHEGDRENYLARRCLPVELRLS